MIKINSKGFIEPRVGSVFKIDYKELNVIILEKGSDIDTGCRDCVFYDDINCSFVCS